MYTLLYLDIPVALLVVEYDEIPLKLASFKQRLHVCGGNKFHSENYRGARARTNNKSIGARNSGDGRRETVWEGSGGDQDVNPTAKGKPGDA